MCSRRNVSKLNVSQNSDTFQHPDSDLSVLDESEDEFNPQDFPAQMSDVSDDDVNPSTTQSAGWTTADRQPAVNVFTGTQGPTAAAHVSNLESPLDYFLLFFTADVLRKLVLETNRYAAQAMAANLPIPSAPSKQTPWTDVNEEELKEFFGLVMMMGVVKKNGGLSSYWSRDERLVTPFFPSVMARHRFQQISTYLHFNNNAELQEKTEDKLYKIRPVYSLIVERWRSMYNLGKAISIEEGMMKWRGRSAFRVYQKDILTKYGIKSYMLADVKTKYCWNIDIYHGVSKTPKETVTALLTPKCMSMWHSLYMDNFWNSVALSEFLLEKKVHIVGTLRGHRENKHLSGVYQMISYNPFTRETLKWTTNIFYCFMEISAHNAFVLYRAKSIQRKFDTFYKFLLELAGQLCRPQFEAESSDDDDDLQPPPSKKAKGDPADRLRGGHKRHRLELFPARGVRKHAQKPCSVCKKNGIRKDTTYYCIHCDVALCVVPCFNKYHTQENY